MKRKDLGSAVIRRLDYPNKGRFLLEESGEEGIVKNVIPGQRVLFRVYKKHKGVVYGTRVEVLEASPLETREPFCEHFGNCGGCLYQTVPYEEQLRMKEDQVLRLLKDIVSPETVYDGVKGSPAETEYRNKIDLSFGDSYVGGPLTLGMHKMGTRYTVLDAECCALMHPDLRTVLKTVRDYFSRREVPFYNKLRHEGFLRYLMLRRSQTSGEILMVLATSSQMEYDFSPLVEELLGLGLSGSFAGIFHAVCDRYADALLPDELHCLYGRDYFYEDLLGLRFRISLFSFFQTNTAGAAVLYDTVREYVRMAGNERGEDIKKPILYDLYCGTGTIAQVLAENAEHVYGIELVEEAVEAAKANAALNRITNCTFLAGDVFETLPLLPEKPDFVILDPPREGVHEKTIKKLLTNEIRDMIYVSCKASSFVEDMRCFREAGWRIGRYALVDLFPQTCHCELVAKLTRGM